jgi:hypothetical protein
VTASFDSDRVSADSIQQAGGFVLSALSFSQFPVFPPESIHFIVKIKNLSCHLDYFWWVKHFISPSVKIVIKRTVHEAVKM